jgi:hypothetical protein
MWRLRAAGPSEIRQFGEQRGRLRRLTPSVRLDRRFRPEIAAGRAKVAVPSPNARLDPKDPVRQLTMTDGAADATARGHRAQRGRWSS